MLPPLTPMSCKNQTMFVKMKTFRNPGDFLKDCRKEDVVSTGNRMCDKEMDSVKELLKCWIRFRRDKVRSLWSFKASHRIDSGTCLNLGIEDLGD